MTISYVTEQVEPAATTLTDIYTIGTVIVSKIVSVFICNKGAGADTVRIAQSVGGGAIADKDYIYYNLSIASTDTFLITTPIFGNSGDIIRVYSTTGDTSFTLQAQETT